MVLWTLLLAVAGLLQASVQVHANNSARLLMIEELRTASHEKDVLARVPRAQRHLWEYDDGRNINETLQSFKDISVEVLVVIKLIGFDGDGINHVKLRESELVRYMRALHLDAHTAVLEPEAKTLSIQPRFRFEVAKASRELTEKLSQGLMVAAFERKKSSRAGYVNTYLPHAIVDNILAAEERSAGPGVPTSRARARGGGGGSAPALTLYLMNLEPPASTDYLYSYNEHADLVASGNWSAFQSCPGALYVSETRTSGGGFAWVDLAAEPHTYGPLRGGEGQVFPHSLPHAGSFRPETASAALLPSLAALAASAVTHLAWPPLAHGGLALPRPDGTNTLVVQVVHIHDTLGPPTRSVDLEVIQHELSGVLSGSSLQVDVREAFISFAHCELCVNAYTNAQRVRIQRQEGSAVVASAKPILDRLLLHQTLAEYGEIIMAYAGVHETHNVLPVFVYDLSLREEVLLLDGVLQAAAFPDMVVAVASRGGPTRVRFSCGHTPRSITPGDVTRGVLAGVLQSAFGAPHIATRYHPVSGASWNYLWALGSTPFGPLSSLTTVSAATAASSTRNLALVELDKQAGRVARVLQALSSLCPKGKWSAALPEKRVRERVHARMNVASLKLELAAEALSQGRHADALRLARHLSHDASSLERMALRLEDSLGPRLECAGGTDWSVLLWPPAGSLLAWGAAACWRSRGARLRAEARYDKIY